MAYFDGKKIPTKKVGRIDTVGGDNTEMIDKVIPKSIYNTTS